MEGKAGGDGVGTGAVAVTPPPAPSTLPPAMVPPAAPGTLPPEPGTLSPARRYGAGAEGTYTYGDKPAHKVDDEERTFKRNILAGILGIAAGVMFLLGGVTGAGLWLSFSDWVSPELGDMRGPVESLLIVIAAVAGLGGVLVMAGGLAILAQRIFAGNLLVLIGGGTGLLGLALSLGLSLWQGAFSEFWGTLAGLLSFSGTGTILSIASGLMTKLPFSLLKMLRGRR